MAIDDRHAHLAFSRFGLGARAGAGLRALGSDPRGAVLAEIGPAPLLPADGLPATPAALQELDEFRSERRKARQRAEDALAEAERKAREAAVYGPPPPPPPMRNPALETYRTEAERRFAAAQAAPVGFAERLVWFWANHFCVAAAKGQAVRITAGAFEREAIRPHVFGRFADMLLAVETHPAMLIFLDNRQSVGPNSRAGERRGRGLNENLAREILELHTLGVGGGYSQADVTSLALAITGWTVVGPFDEDHELGEFFFNRNRHEPGAPKVLGRSYGQPGFEKGRAALADIARHPSTARFIATKLVRHFVADDPPAALVSRVAAAFADGDGDLPRVYRALVEADETWAAPPAKMRTPQEFLAASLRALDRPARGPQVLNLLNGLGQPLWNPAGPNGFPDSAAYWASAEGLKTRLDVAAQLARQAPGIDPRERLETVVGAAASRETRQAVARAESREQGLALMLMSPEFQRR